MYSEQIYRIDLLTTFIIYFKLEILLTRSIFNADENFCVVYAIFCCVIYVGWQRIWSQKYACDINNLTSVKINPSFVREVEN